MLTQPLIWCVLIVLLSTPSVISAETEKDGEVIILTSKNFDTVVTKSRFALVEFYADWCGHCQELAPKYKEAAELIKKYNPDIVVAKIDAIAESAVSQAFEVDGLPTLRWFENGDVRKPERVNCERSAQGIYNWVQRKTMPVAFTLNSLEYFKTIEMEYPIMVLAYYGAFKGKDYDTFISVAKTIPDVTFVQTTNSDIAKAAGLEQYGIVALKTFVGDDRSAVFSQTMSPKALTEFIFSEKMPTTIQYHPSTLDKIFKSAVPFQLFLWAKGKYTRSKSPMFQMFREAALDFKGKVVFVTVNNKGEDHQALTDYHNIQNETEDPLILASWVDPTMVKKDRKYRLDGEISVESLKGFARSLLNGTAAPVVKSAPIPDEPTENGVTVVVGKTFNDIVMDPTKDVLLQVYTNTCEHCKTLQPIYSKLAGRFRPVGSVVIAKMDSSVNDHYLLDVKGVPSLFFFPASEGAEPISFDNGDKERTLQSLTQFIKDNARIPYELAKKGSKDEL